MSQQYVPNLGNLCDEMAMRDCVHIALAPVIATERLSPGQRANVLNGTVYADEKSPVGIIDPYLTEDVEPGQKCWLLLMPGTITGMRHCWTHPAFKLRIPEKKS